MADLTDKEPTENGLDERDIRIRPWHGGNGNLLEVGESMTDKEPTTRIFAFRHRNHDAYWCSQACKDEGCAFGPCCEPKPVRMVPYEGEIDVV